jgi:hypothetical protein
MLCALTFWQCVAGIRIAVWQLARSDSAALVQPVITGPARLALGSRGRIQAAAVRPSTPGEFHPSLSQNRTFSHVPYKSQIELRAALHAGCRLGSLRTSPKLIPEEWHPPGFGIV